MKGAREKLKDHFDQYMEFDINDLDIEIKKNLQAKIEEASAEFFVHRERADAQLSNGHTVNSNSLAVQTETVALRKD